jgi:phosphoadenosine phosphosulfate reductase family protein
MTMQERWQQKAEETLQFLRAEVFAKYKAPVLNCSFGKDSCVLLHLLLSNEHRMPIVYYRDPFFPRKNDFANKVISMWNLEVHDYPPQKTSLLHGKEIVALVSEYQTGRMSTVAVLKNALEFQDDNNPDDFLCGVLFLMRPCAVFNYPWDAALVAHKDVDEDQIYGVVPLASPIVYRDEGPDFIFPLKDWTHDDVWDYTIANKVPFQSDRYDLEHRTEWPDKTYNSDWYPVCIRCIDKRKAGEQVFCPKHNVWLENVSSEAPEFGYQPDYFKKVKR